MWTECGVVVRTTIGDLLNELNATSKSVLNIAVAKRGGAQSG